MQVLTEKSVTGTSLRSGQQVEKESYSEAGSTASWKNLVYEEKEKKSANERNISDSSVVPLLPI